MPTRFLWDNEWDNSNAILTVSTENANFPGSNTQHRWWQKTWRTTSYWAQTITEDQGGDISASVMALKYNNFTGAATEDIYVRASVNPAFWAPPAYDKEFSVFSNDVMVEYFSATKTYQHWRLALSAAANPDGYFTVGRIFLGSYWSPGRDFRIGGGRRNRVDTSLMTTGEQGHIATVILEKRNVYEYVFPCLSASDLTQFIAIFDALGMSRGFFFTEDSTAPTTTTYYVRFAAPLGIQQEENGLYTVSVSLEESM